jgi:hypothetical protein
MASIFNHKNEQIFQKVSTFILLFKSVKNSLFVNPKVSCFQKVNSRFYFKLTPIFDDNPNNEKYKNI